MIYRLLRLLVRLTLHAYFRRIYILDAEKLPLDKPVLIACNHPSAFMEAVILACFLPRPLHFLVRGDVFRNPRFRWFFKATNQVPIYRFRDGFANLRNNARTLDYCYETLKEGHAILIFSEGSTELVRRLRPLQKGTARIAMGAIDFSPELDLHIVPVGVNFTDPTMFRSDVMVRVGDPIRAQDYYEAYRADAPGTFQVITEDLTGRLKPCVVHIGEHLHEHQVEPLFSILRSGDRGFKGPVSHKDPQRFRMEWALANALGEMSPRFFDYLLEKVDTLERLMPRLHFNRPVTFLHRTSLLGGLLGLVFYPVYWLSLLIWGVPFGIAHWITERKVKQIEFYGPVRLGAGMLLSLLWGVLMWVAGGVLLPFGWYWAWLIPLFTLASRLYLQDHYRMRGPGMLMQWMHPNRRKKVRNQFDQLLVDVQKLAEKNHQQEGHQPE